MRRDKLKHSLLDRLSSVHFAIPLFIYVRIIYFFSEQAFIEMDLAGPVFAVFFVGGILLWMFMAYVWLQTVLHFKRTSVVIRGIYNLIHGMHHRHPEDDRRVMISPFVSIPLAVATYYLLATVVPDNYLYALYPGLLTGYLVYDMGHYALHHIETNNARWELRRKQHFLQAHVDACSEDAINHYFEHRNLRPDFTKY
jgi:hypothetical protein